MAVGSGVDAQVGIPQLWGTSFQSSDTQVGGLQLQVAPVQAQVLGWAVYSSGKRRPQDNES